MIHPIIENIDATMTIVFEYQIIEELQIVLLIIIAIQYLEHVLNLSITRNKSKIIS